MVNVNKTRSHKKQSGSPDEQYPNLCVHQLFELQARRSPDAVAVIAKDRQLTYRELNQRANQVAHFLRRNGVSPETLVGVCLERSLELVVGLLGVWKAGGAYIPLDPVYPAERLAFMVADAGVRILLTERKLEDLFRVPDVTVVCLDEAWPTFAQESTADLSTDVSPANLAYVMYTSGSTGQPKGAMIVHSGLVNYLSWAIKTYAVVPGGSVPVHSSIAFDLTVTSLYPALLTGGQVELLAEDVGAQNLVQALRERGDRCLVKLTPAHLDVLTHQLRREELAGVARAFVIGGENLPAESLSLWREFAPNTRLINEYGPTETVVGCCIHEVAASDPCTGPVPIGLPIANTQLYVLDPAMQPVPVGDMGELFIGGAGVARGYLNRPELTQERFLPDPFSGRAGAKLYKTGDLARYRADGILEFLGRVDNQVKVRGYRIELGDIESNLASHPDVQSCAVLAREDSTGGKQLVGYVVARAGRHPSAEDLQAFVKQQLPEYMVPAHVVFLPSLPLTINGKVDRKALPAPSAASAAASKKFTAPRNETERAVATIWAELLKVEAVGIDDDFFDLGGHSLLAIRALARLRDAVGIDLEPQALFESSKLAAFAALVSDAKGEVQDNHTIPPRGTDGPCVPSFTQEQMWLLDQIVPGSPAYNIVDVVPLHGAYDAGALKGALQELVRRHESLRTAFRRVEGQLMQTVSAPFEPELAEVDLSSAAEEQRQPAWARLAAEQARKPFDLSRIPLIRVCVVHFSASEHRVLLTIHHIIADEWSMELVQKELGELYVAFAKGRPSPLLSLPVQYADFAVWQRERLNGDALRAQLDYWKSELKDAPTVLALPTDKPRPDTATLRGATESFALPADLLPQLQSLGRQEQATLFMVLETAFAALLYRYTGQDDILVGTPISERTHTETQQMIGCFLNTVVLRAQFPEGLSCRALLRQVRGRALGAYANAELPFQRLISEVSHEREPGASPLFQVMFVMHNRSGTSQVSKLSGNRELETGTSKFDLTLFLSETDKGLEGLIEYSTDLFEAETVRGLCRSYGHLLAAMAREPDVEVSRIPILVDADRQLLLLDRNRTSVDFPEGQLCLHDLVVRQAARTPDRVALVFAGQTLSYGELDRRSDQLARHLVALGVVPDMLVGLLVERSFDMVVGLLGILKAGGAYVPLDPSFPADRLAYVIDDAQMQVLVTHRRLDEALHKRPSSVVHLDRDLDEIAKRDGNAPLQVGVNSGHLAYVLYTSGSTGMPKGVAIPHSAIVNLILATQREPGITRMDTLLAISTLSFDIAGFDIYGPLTTGAKMVIGSREDAMDPYHLMALLRENACTFMQATPATWRALIDVGWKGSSRLRAVCTGEAMPRDLAQRLLPRCAQLWNLYGPTETTVWSTGHKLTPLDVQVPIGHPIANTQVYILDAHLELVPPGAVGELYIAGRGLARGYLHREQLTRERFVPSPFDANARLYRTGDLARWRVDGCLECLGRTDHQVKVRGYRIELGEIENCISQHPNIRQVVVIAREDVAGDKRLVAYVVAKDPPADLMEELRARLRSAVPEYMVPAHFVALRALPLTPTGKVDRKALPAPGEEVRAATAAPAPSGRAASDAETCICDIFCELLHLQSAGLDRNFFDLGGNSLSAVSLFAAIREQLGVQLPMSTIFSASTPRQIARIVEAARLPGSTGSLVSPTNPKAQEPTVHFGLSLLRAGDEGKVPLLLIHGDVANGLLPPHLPDGHPLWGYSHQGSDGERIRLTTVEALAERCHEEWLEHVGRGPCVIAGHSFGGLVAYQMGVLRQQEGLLTARLVMLDTVHPSSFEGDRAGLGPHALRNRFRLAPKQQEWRKAREEATRILDAGGIVPLEKRSPYILGVYGEAAIRYRPPRWFGTLDVVRCLDGKAVPVPDYWERSVVGNVRRLIVPGDHLAIVRSAEGFAPIGRRLAEMMVEVQARLSRARVANVVAESHATVPRVSVPAPTRWVQVIIVGERFSSPVENLLGSLSIEQGVAAEHGVALHAVVVDNTSAGTALPGPAVADPQWREWVQILDAPKRGSAHGHNLGFRHGFAASRVPDYFMLLSPATEVRPGAIPTLVQFLEEHPQAGVAASTLEQHDGEVRPTAFCYPSAMAELGDGLASRLAAKWFGQGTNGRGVGSSPGRVERLPAVAMMIRREVVEQLGGMDEKYSEYYEDMDFCRKVTSAGWELWCVPESRVLHFAGDGADCLEWRTGSTPTPDSRFEDRRRYFMKHHGLPYAVATDAVLFLSKVMDEAREVVTGEDGLALAQLLVGLLRHSPIRRANRTIPPPEEFRPGDAAVSQTRGEK
jgi:surfactin family lipopeptide synthetase A